MAERARPDVNLLRLPEKYRSFDPDQRLPVWARRSNPIVHRQLGMYWKTILPEVDVLARLIGIQIALIALTLPLPFLFDLALPTITAALLLLPMALYAYAHILFAIGSAAAIAIVDELRGGTLDLVRTTPLSLISIMGSKIAAAIWRQVENLSLLMMAAAVISLPLLISQYAVLLPLTEYPFISRLAMILGLVVSVARLALEPAMIGAIGLMAGAGLPTRPAAVIAAAFLGGAYFLLINLARLIPMAWPARFVVEFALPLALPLLITYGALRLAHHLLSRD